MLYKYLRSIVMKSIFNRLFPPRHAASLCERCSRPLPESNESYSRQEPKTHDCVSILFLDIVGFVQMSSNMEPVKVMNLLDCFYGQADELIRQHDLFKIDTIGDSLLVVGNIHRPQPDHMVRMARLAEDLMRTARRTPVDPEFPEVMLHIRVGIHAGQVVSSVVGGERPRFCVLGNSVNLASRMESTGIAGKIQISNQARDLLLQQAPEDIRKRVIRRVGTVDIKGGGKLSTYWLTLQEDIGTRDEDAQQ